MSGATGAGTWRRRGSVVLAVVVACIVLVGSFAFSFHFVMRSAGAQVRLIERQIQARTMADLSSDALQSSIEDYGQGRTTQIEPWIRGILDRLDSASHDASALDDGHLEVTDSLLVNPLVLELLGRAGLGQDALLDPAIVEARVGPFRIAPAPHDSRVYYADPTFVDSSNDQVPLDLRAPVTIATEVTSWTGPFISHQRDELRWQMALTDTAPIAAQHALFAYEPPGDADTALNDLQRGGRFTVFPLSSGRVMVRGPLVLLPEDGPASGPGLWGGPLPAPGSLNYPGGHWSGWAGIPGPRALQLPPGAVDKWVIDATNALLGWFGISAPFADYGPMRPQRDHSPTHQIGPLTLPVPGAPLKAGPWPLWLSILVGPGMGTNVGFFYPVFADDQIARYDPGAYYYSPLDAGTQTFSIMGRADPSPPGPGQPTMRDMYRGVHIHAKGGPDEAMADGVLPAGADDGDAMLPEPVPDATTTADPELGILGLYGVGVFDNTDYYGLGVVDTVSWFFPPAKGIMDILGALGISPDLYILFRAWEVNGGLDALSAGAGAGGAGGGGGGGASPLTLSQVTDLCSGDRASLIPYGMHWFSHDFYEARRWEKFALDMGIGAALSVLLKPLTGGASKKVFHGEEGTDFAKAVADRGLGKALAMVLRRWVQGAADHTMGEVLSHILGQVIDVVLKAVVWNLANDIAHRAVDRLIPSRAQSPLAVGGLASKLLSQYPHGFFPARFREFDQIATRAYPDMGAYLLEEQVQDASLGAVLELRGVVRLQKADYHGPAIRYRGRGILVVESNDPAAPATLDAPIEPVDDRSLLILVHLVDAQLMGRADVPMLRLGPHVVGSVVSETGVVPATARSTLIEGNLVEGQIYKSRIDAGLTGPGEGVQVVYASAYRSAAIGMGSRTALWSAELVSGLDAIDLGQ